MNTTMEFDINKLTPAGRVMAMRYGHTLLANDREVLQAMDALGDHLDQGESFLLRPLGNLGAGVRVYSLGVKGAVHLTAAK